MFNNNQHPETFSLFDLEDAVERSVSVLPMSRHGQTDFFSNSEILQKSKSFHFNVEEAEEQAEAFTDNCRDHETTLHPLPMYYLLDSTHLRLSAMSTFMCAYTHPLEAVLGAHKLLPSCFEIDIDMSSKRTTRTKKIKGMMWMGSECVDFRVHCFQDGSDTLIEFHRRSGSAFVFQQYFNLIAPFLVTSKNATTFVAPSLKKRRQSAQTAESIDHAFALSVKEGALAMTSFLHNENTNKNKTDTSINSLFLDTLCECLKQNGQNGTFQEGSWDTNNTRCVVVVCLKPVIVKSMILFLSLFFILINLDLNKIRIAVLLHLERYWNVYTKSQLKIQDRWKNWVRSTFWRAFVLQWVMSLQPSVAIF